MFQSKFALSADAIGCWRTANTHVHAQTRSDIKGDIIEKNELAVDSESTQSL
jgi:hypothetical protein